MSDEHRERAHRRMIELRILFVRGSRNPDLLRQSFENAVDSSSYDPFARPRDPLEHALGGFKQCLQDSYTLLRRGTVIGVPLLFARFRARLQRYRSHVSSSAAWGATVGANVVHGLLTASVALLLAAGASPSLVSGIPASTRISAEASRPVSQPTQTLATDWIGLRAAITTADVVPSAPAGARVGATVGKQDHRIAIGREVVVRVGEEEYPILDGPIFYIDCDTEARVSQAACAAYHNAEPVLRVVGKDGA